MQGEARRDDVGVVAAFVFKLLRSATGCRQTDIAERLRVDVSTIQGWESGRRPLSALSTTNLLRLRNSLIALGAPASAAKVLIDAVEADVILSTVIGAGSLVIDAGAHPLGVAVLRRSLLALVTWPFTGVAPAPLRGLGTPLGRGPAPTYPQLSADMRDRFFDHMLTAADSATSGDAALLRRQAVYLLGYDSRPGTMAWLTTEYQRIVRANGATHTPAGFLLGRSAALGLARHGDLDPIRRFIGTDLTEPQHASANLVYWAYWLGEIPEAYASDGDMLLGGEAVWTGHRLMGHLLNHLDDPKHADLNAHTLWSLVLARPNLLDTGPVSRSEASTKVEVALHDGLDQRAYRELSEVYFATRLAGR
ncbi:helix-turn-helix domain-containing protein [Antribacter sp. KLBMP9083]|uniref:Helix-turn-helix domain-containing protein n=1 Tax=Antribacter soli TaxID=2910976 RepID=A0AA41UAB4_9MICO|nr:helix-turn-helix transcriptional regulator [Antribacter soli]MCF4119969.1 helix-turn-helix domain-containing protein [Antribacter soli]